MTITKAKEILEDSFTVINTHGLWTADEEIEAQEMAIEALKLIPDNATNGDVIKAIFPHYDVEIDEHKGYVRIFYDDFYTTYPLRWWNAPYKREGEQK